MSHGVCHRKNTCSSWLDVGLISWRSLLLAPVQVLFACLFTLYNLETAARWIRWSCFGVNILEACKSIELLVCRWQIGPAIWVVFLSLLCPPLSELAPSLLGCESKLLFSSTPHNHLHLSSKEFRLNLFTRTQQAFHQFHAPECCCGQASTWQEEEEEAPWSHQVSSQHPGSRSIPLQPPPDELL